MRKLFGVINDRNDLGDLRYMAIVSLIWIIFLLNERGFSGFLDINGTFKLLNEDVSFEGMLGQEN